MGFGDSRFNSALARHMRRDSSDENSSQQVPIYSTARTVSAALEGDYSSELGGPTQSTEHAIHNGNPRTALEEGDRIAVIESRVFLRECIRRGMQPAFSIPLDTYESIAELEKDDRLRETRLVIISWSSEDQGRSGENADTVVALSQLAPGAPIIVLAHRKDPETARGAIAIGARGYIPMSMGFDLAVEVVRFALAGGTYVPPEYFLAEAPAPAPAIRTADPGAMTARELLVVRAIQQGKPNKIIAYELNMCESTVKVHVRHIMKKLGAKNRTAVAMKANGIATLSRIANK
jgi:DNA-binding NarL/FixJ family response regulator